MLALWESSAKFYRVADLTHVNRGAARVYGNSDRAGLLDKASGRLAESPSAICVRNRRAV